MTTYTSENKSMFQDILNQLDLLKKSFHRSVGITPGKVNTVLNDLAASAELRKDDILLENKKDLNRMDPADPKYDRLLLNDERIQHIAADIRKIARLKSPLGRTLESRTLNNGLHLKKVTVPLGVIGIVFESRPNVIFDVFSICFKSGNACVLKGSRDAMYSNRCIVNLIQEILEVHQVPNLVYLSPPDRQSLLPILNATRVIDAIIPRGSQGLIDFVRQNATVPVIETGAGIVHTYVDQSADIGKAKAIVKNAKTRRVSVCNALDTLIVHREQLPNLPMIVQGLDSEFGLKIYADPGAFQALQNNYSDRLLETAEKDHFGTEFLSMKMAIKTVNDLEEALDHIQEYSSKHSEAIIAEDQEIINSFLNRVDAAVVYANTSTAFTDGAQFGMGAEIGISTQKLHARGPMALNELTSYKWIVTGNGQVRS